MNKDEMKRELEALRECVKQLEKEIEHSEQPESSSGGFSGYYNNRGGIGGPHGGGRTARPQRGKYHY